MRAKPDMKTWVHTEGKDEELRQGAQKNVWKQLILGLRPGLYRSVALAGLFDISPNQFLCYFDAVALPQSGERGSISTATLTLN